MEQDLSVEAGVERALQIMRFIFGPPGKRPPEAKHDITSDEDKARLITSDLRVIVKCLPRGEDKVLTIIIVAGHDDRQTQGTMETFRNVMKSGNIGGLLE